MKRAILTATVFLSVFSAFSQIQTLETDSLFQLYEKSSGKERLEYIYRLCTSDNIPYPEIDKLSLEALSLASKQDSGAMIIADYSRAYYHFISSAHDSARYYLGRFINDIPGKDNYLIYAYSWVLLFGMDVASNEYAKSTKWTDKIRHLSERFGDSLVRAYYYKACGEREYFTGNNQKGIDYFSKAKNIFEKNKEYNSLAICYMRLSGLYMRTGVINKATYNIGKALELEDSISVLKKSRIYLSLATQNYGNNDININRKQLLLKALENAAYLKDFVLTANIYAGIALLLYQNDEIDSALLYWNRSSHFYRKVHDLNNVGINHYNLSLALMEQGKFAESRVYLDSALTIIRNNLKTDDFGAVYLNMAVLYSKQDQEQLKFLYLDSIRQIYPRLSPSIQLQILDYFIKDNKEKNNFRKALEYYEKRTELNDSLLKMDYDKKVNEIFVKYKTKEQEQENRILKSNIEKERQKAKLNLYAMLGVLFLFIFTAALFIIFRKNTLIRRKLQEEELVRKNAQIRQKDEEFKRIETEKLLIQEKNKLLSLEKEMFKQKLDARNNLLQVTNNSLFRQQQQNEELLKKLKELKVFANSEGKKQINELIANLNKSLIENNWTTFERTFTVLYPDFVRKLNELQPELSLAERRSCAFIKMNLKTAEIKAITSQSRQSIYDIKKRLRLKFGIDTNENLEDFIRKL